MTCVSIPQTTQAWAKPILLDTLGVMQSGSRPVFPGIRKLVEFVRAERDDGPCLVVGTDLHTSPVNAALVNGWLGYALDNESYHRPAVPHAAAACLPAALAVAQERECDGAAFLDAFILGIKVDVRAALDMGPNDLYARGIHPTSIAGAFGAAASASHLLGLDPQQTGRVSGWRRTRPVGCQPGPATPVRSPAPSIPPSPPETV